MTGIYRFENEMERSIPPSARKALTPPFTQERLSPSVSYADSSLIRGSLGCGGELEKAERWGRIVYDQEVKDVKGLFFMWEERKHRFA